jgi:hypothetical protein
MVYAHAALGAGLADRFEECNEIAGRAAELGRRGNMGIYRAVNEALEAWSGARLRPHEDNLGRLRTARAQVESTGSDRTVTIIHPAGLEGDVLILTGRPDEAVGVLQAGLEAATEIGHLVGLPELYRLLAIALNETGDQSGAKDALRRSLAMALDQGTHLFVARAEATGEAHGING